MRIETSVMEYRIEARGKGIDGTYGAKMDPRWTPKDKEAREMLRVKKSLVLPSITCGTH